MLTYADLNNRFDYHAPDKPRTDAHQKVRACLKRAATDLCEHCPATPELGTAIRKLEEAMMWANAAIARHPIQLPLKT